MSETSLRPCPFSNHRIQADQAWRLLAVFAVYQTALGALFWGLFQLRLGPSQLGQLHPQLFFSSAGAYALTAFASLPCLKWRLAYAWQAAGHVFLDLALLPFLIYASGGLESGFAVLLAVSVVAAGLLVGGRCALGFAALASLDVLALESIGNLQGVFATSHYTYAAVLGVAYFTIAWLAVVLAGRAEQSQLLADRRKVALANLEQLNEFIVQHLQSGILVLDSTLTVRLCNDSALRLLKLPQRPKALVDLPEALVTRLREWQAHPQPSSATLTTASGPIHVRFSRLPMQSEVLTMIFLEDEALHQQRVQESKLASLGRLTASIAHEIRNPLSAISHASQLLGESQNLTPQELRLVEIVQKHCRRVNAIVGNVLQLSRRQAARRERLALNPWLAQFCLEFEEENQRPKLFDLQLPKTTLNAFVDSSQLKQILCNLCGNALQYGTPAGEPITLRLRRHEPTQKPCIEVIDRGPGIPPEQVQNVFEPFFTTSPTGTGLGLYIARELAQLNQANLEYEFGRDGSCFRLILANADQVWVEL
ncbi:two-component system sensor histidine kinase PilS [Methylothermus subterraneus]